MSVITIILNDSPYGSEKAYNGLRVALALLKHEQIQVNIFLMSDAVYCALKEQTTPDGYYNISRMIKRIAKQGKVGACGTCMDTRGLSNLPLLTGVHRSAMKELANWILASEKVIPY